MVSVLTLSSFSFTGFVAEKTVDEVGSDWTGPRSFEAFSARFYGATDFQITAAPAPEPAALGLLGLGPAGLELMRRRRGN